MLWLTRPSQIYCSDPQYAGVLGLLRVVRNEMGAPLCTFELDATASPKGWQAVFKVYQKIRRMRTVEPYELADPDCEFAYSDGTVYLPRFRWISVADELAARSEDQPLYKRLEIGKRGLLKLLQWVERPLLDNLTGDEVYADIRAIGMNFKVSSYRKHMKFSTWARVIRIYIFLLRSDTPLLMLSHLSSQSPMFVLPGSLPYLYSFVNTNAGIRYQDTLIAMGIINGPTEAGGGFGVECSGIIRAVGPDVTDLSRLGIGSWLSHRTHTPPQQEQLRPVPLKCRTAWASRKLRECHVSTQLSSTESSI